MPPSLSDLPPELLARVLCALPCDSHARCAVLSRRFAALIFGSGVTWTRVAFACDRTLDTFTRRALLQRAGSALLELDASGAHAADEGVLSSTLALLCDAQRGALTTLRCTQQCASAHSATPVADAASALEQCPRLTTLEVELKGDTAAPLAALIRGHPQLRARRVYLTANVPGLTEADALTLLGGCSELHVCEPLQGLSGRPGGGARGGARRWWRVRARVPTLGQRGARGAACAPPARCGRGAGWRLVRRGL